MNSIDVNNNIWILVRSGDSNSILNIFTDLVHIEKAAPVSNITEYSLMNESQVLIVTLNEEWTFIGGWGLPYNSNNTTAVKIEIMKNLTKNFSKNFSESHFYLCDTSQLDFGWLKFINGKLERSYIFGYDNSRIPPFTLLEDTGNISEIEKLLFSNPFSESFSEVKIQGAGMNEVHKIASNWASPIINGYQIKKSSELGYILKTNITHFDAVQKTNIHPEDEVPFDTYDHNSLLVKSQGWGWVRLGVHKKTIEKFLREQGILTHNLMMATL